MNDLQNWLISRIPSLVPCHLPEINFGTDRLSLKYDSRNEITNPLSLRVQSRNEKNDLTEDGLNFTVSGQSPEIQFIKRMQHTPFYISSLSGTTYNMYLIDFYEWSPVTTIFRIFYFHSIEPDSKIELRVSAPSQTDDGNINQDQKFYLSHSGIGKNEVKDEYLTIEVSEKDTKNRILILTLSENQTLPGDLSIKSILEKLGKLESVVKTSHILNDLKIQNVKIRQLIDELWNRQKGLNPDRSLQTVDGITDIWSHELCQYMGWSISGSTTKTKLMNLLKDSDPIKELYYKAYFTDSYTLDEIIESLQAWWDQYSLPLYRMKLLRMIQTDPSLIFVIYLLAHQMRLPWYEQLYDMSHNFFKTPQIALLACLFQIAILKTGKDNIVRIIPGAGYTGNVGALRRGDIEYAYTHFGRFHFSALVKKNVELLKINKKVILSHNRNLDQLTVSPDLPTAKLDKLRTNPIVIQIDKTVIQIPLLWKKSEILLPDCRIRWIFKKDRFQFTCQAKKPGISLKINDQYIDFTQSNHAHYYHPVEKSGNGSSFNLFDRWGRSYTMNQYTPRENVNLIGWIQDRYGLLVEKYNLGINFHQIPKVVNASGSINVFFEINSNLDKIRIASKKRIENIPIRKITDSRKINLMSYLHTESKGTLVVIVDDELKIQKREFEKLFLSTIGFIPLIYYKSEIKKKINNPFLIFIGERDTMSQIREIKGLSKVPLLSISYPEGILQLNKILSDTA
jgi:hypothetical protein